MGLGQQCRRVRWSGQSTDVIAGKDDDAENLQESLSDSRELVEGEMKELPEQLQEHAVGTSAGSLGCTLNVKIPQTA